MKQLTKRKRLKNGDISSLPQRTKRHKTSDEGSERSEEESEEELELSDREDERRTMEETASGDEHQKTEGAASVLLYHALRVFGS